MNRVTRNSDKEAAPKVELRSRIVVQATELFKLHGIRSITMDDIAALVGISKRTLYEVFQDKEALLMECILKAQEETDAFLSQALSSSNNVLEVIILLYKRSIQHFYSTNKRFFEDIKRYPQVHQVLRKYRESDSESAIAFFKMGVEQGIIRDDINFAIVNLLVREQIRILMDTDICKDHSFLEVYESIMFTYIRGISTVRGAEVLEEFIKEYRKEARAQELPTNK